MNRETKEIAKAMVVMPRLMRLCMGTFKPKADVTLKKNEIKALFEIDMNPGLPMKHYADAIDMEFGSFTYLCDKLEKKNLVERTHSESDKRVTVLNLTKKGIELGIEVKEEFDEHITKIIKTLDSKDLDNLSKSICLLEDILKKLEN